MSIMAALFNVFLLDSFSHIFTLSEKRKRKCDCFINVVKWIKTHCNELKLEYCIIKENTIFFLRKLKNPNVPHTPSLQFDIVGK